MIVLFVCRIFSKAGKLTFTVEKTDAALNHVTLNWEKLILSSKKEIPLKFKLGYSRLPAGSEINISDDGKITCALAEEDQKVPNYQKLKYRIRLLDAKGRPICDKKKPNVPVWIDCTLDGGKLTGTIGTPSDKESFELALRKSFGALKAQLKEPGEMQGVLKSRSFKGVKVGKIRETLEKLKQKDLLVKLDKSGWKDEDIYSIPDDTLFGALKLKRSAVSAEIWVEKALLKKVKKVN